MKFSTVRFPAGTEKTYDKRRNMGNIFRGLDVFTSRARPEVLYNQ
jgi:hypothetical protein